MDNKVLKVKTSWPLKIAPISCPEMLVWNYHSTPRNVPEERRPQNYVITPHISVLFLHPLNYEPPANQTFFNHRKIFKKSSPFCT